MTTHEPKLDIKTIITIFGVIIAGVVTFYASQMATAEEIAQVKSDARVMDLKVETTVSDVSEIKADIKALNAKVDVLLINQGFNPKTIESITTATTAKKL